MSTFPRTALVLSVFVTGLIIACSDDTVVPGDDGTVACTEREAVPLPEETGPIGTIRTWAGTGEAAYDGDCHAVLQSSFYWPIDIEFTPNIGTYIVDWNNHRIRRVTEKGRLETIAGTNLIGDGPEDESDQIFPGAPGTSCRLNHPTDVFERNDGKLVIVSWHNHKLREWDPVTGNLFVTIGREANCAGDGGAAVTAKINQPVHAAQAPDGSIYILDQRNQVIRKIDPQYNISTVVGTIVCPTPAPLDPGGFEGDDGDPKLAKMRQPTGPNPPPGGGIAINADGILYFADMNNHRIRRVDFGANVITTVVGNGTAGYSGDNMDPRLASLNLPADLEFGPDGRLYIADAGNNVVRAVDFGALTIVTVAGDGQMGFGGDGGPATSAQLANPQGIAFDAAGDLYIADTFNQRIRRVKMH
jgi:sugar lactone lactonase YvrE